jgi:Heterokaryon incompatibility protein (HET)
VPDNLNPGNEETYIWAGHRLQECVSSHEHCPKPVQGNLPTRVIHIVNEDNLKLVSESQHAHYVALSYCWGGPQTFSTTTQTLTAMQEGFKTFSLPQTLQDAVKVTRKLGLEYLWIDSLCIVQDLDGDQLNELPKMASYYENAYFTLIAGGAKYTDGFLAPRKACDKHKGSSSFRNMLARPFLCRGGDTHVCLFREETPYDLSKEPISKRAWTFQERILSPRVLMYGQRVVWQCKSLQVSDGGCDDWTEDPWSTGHRQIQTALNQASPDGAEANSSAEETSYANDVTTPFDGLYDLWYQIVREYSRRSLTFQDDKFPAISALATKVQSINGDEYLAGLWGNDLLRGLLWSTYPTVTLVKPPTWRAPSWSWASVNNPIEYRRLPGPSAVALAEVINWSVTPKHPTAPHGEIKDVILEISGPIMMPDRDFTKRIMKQDNRVPHDGMETVMTNLAVFNEDPTNVGFVNWEPPENHVLLLVYATMRDGADWNDENGVATMAGLVLGEIEGYKYERVGCFTTMGLQGVKYLTRHVPKKTVKLV